MDIRALAEKYEGYIIEQRRWFHAHPELSWEEFGKSWRRWVWKYIGLKAVPAVLR